MKTAEQIKRLIEQFKPVRKSIDLFDPNLQETSTTSFQLTDGQGDKFRMFLFSERIVIEFPIKTFLLFAVNLPDIVCLANTPLDVSTHGQKIYASNSTDTSVLNCFALIEQDIKDLGLEKNEGVFVYRNAVQLVCSGNRDLVQELSILKRLKSTIENNFPEDDLGTINTSKIPSELHELVPLLAEWAIADDLERDEKIAKSSREELKILADAVGPKIGLINNYLQSFKSKPLSHEATLLGNLAELASELMLSK